MAERQRAQLSRQRAALPAGDNSTAGIARPNTPPTAIDAKGGTPRVPRTSYLYSVPLDPPLRYASSGLADAMLPLLEQGARRS
jgi:hypothetical protein